MATETKPKETEATGGAVVSALILGPLLTFYRAWTVSWLWFWFAVPFGVPMIGAVHMFGLLLIYRLVPFKATGDKPTDNSTESVLRAAFYGFIFTTASLGFGYLAYLHLE